MSGLKEIRTRISSIKTTRQVTSAMKMVSAAKLKRAQDAIIHFRPYAAKLHEIMDHLAGSMDCTVQSPYCVIRPAEKILVVVISSNRGLCGGFNLNIVRVAAELIRIQYADQLKNGGVDILSVGKQGERQLMVAGFDVAKSNNEVWNNLSYVSIEEVASEILESFTSGFYDKVDIVYNEFVNAALQNPVIVDYLPVAVPKGSPGQDIAELTIYEPSKLDIARELIPRMLKTEFHKAMLDSHAAEHGARMTAMHLATDNATELISELTLQYNKARQAAITKEILEITAGAEALRG
jgi:F-type H+-transporting ATPase subunit gamma